MAKQAELGRAELHRTAGAAHAVRFDVHLDVGIGELLAGERRPERRNTAPTRASSSRGLNGLVT